MTRTLILPRRFSSDSIALWHAAARAGWGAHRLHAHNVPESVRELKNLAFYGETLLADCIRDGDILDLGLIEPPMDFLCRLPIAYRSRRVKITTFQMAHHWRKAFIKPADDKAFEARVYNTGELLSSNCAPDLPVLISEIQEFVVEYRMFVLDQKVVTSSIYMREGVPNFYGEPIEALDAQAFAEWVLRDEKLELPPAFVLDVGKMRDGRWAVVEANPAWGSGIYMCDPAKVLEVIGRASGPKSSFSEAEQRWLRP